MGPPSPPIRSTPGIVSCLVGSDSRFSLEVLRWFATATRLAGVPPSALVVNIVGTDMPRISAFLRSQDVTVRLLSPFDARSAHCNKIAGAVSLAAETITGPCVLTDADVAIFLDPRTIRLPTHAVGMRPVDLPNPPLDVLRAVFAKAGVPEPPAVATTRQTAAQTLLGNGNGGLYVIPSQLLPLVATAWAGWARWLLERRGLLRTWSVHVDQVAMALALAAERIDVFDVGPGWNVPIHIATPTADVPVTALLHYHDRAHWDGKLFMTEHATVDNLIVQANRVTGELLREHLAASR